MFIKSLINISCLIFICPPRSQFPALIYLMFVLFFSKILSVSHLYISALVKSTNKRSKIKILICHIFAVYSLLS